MYFDNIWQYIKKVNPTYFLIAVVVLAVVWKLFTRKGQRGGDEDDGNITVTLFYLPGCGFCRDMMPEWDKFESKYPAVVSKVDCNDNPEASAAHGIKGFPTIIKFVDGVKTAVHEGERTASALETFLMEN
jgi:thiol-disulfide isomerase/thioredoxin